MKCSLIFPGRIPPLLCVFFYPQPRSACPAILPMLYVSESTAIITQLTSTEDTFQAGHCSRGVTFMNSSQPQTIHFTDEEAEALLIKSIGLKLCSWEANGQDLTAVN